jgi:hypothetical protein
MRTCVLVTFIALLGVGCSNEGDGGRDDRDGDGDGGDDDDDDDDESAPQKQPYELAAIASECDSLPADPQVLSFDPRSHLTEVVPLPFDVVYFGAIDREIAVSDTGQLFLLPAGGGAISIEFEPSEIPTAATPNGFVAAMWSPSLLFVANRSSLRIAELAGHFTVEWTDFAFGGIVADLQSRLDMQVKLFENGTIEIHHCLVEAGRTPESIASGGDASIGLESGDGLAGVSASFRTSDTVSFETAYRFTPSR